MDINDEYQEIIKKSKFIAKADQWFIEGTEAVCDGGYSYINYKSGDKFNAGWSLFMGSTNETYVGFIGELPRIDCETCPFDEFYIYDEFGNEISELTIEEYNKLK